jgi:hypothetical protein
MDQHPDPWGLPTPAGEMDHLRLSRQGGLLRPRQPSMDEGPDRTCRTTLGQIVCLDTFKAPW